MIGIWDNYQLLLRKQRYYASVQAIAEWYHIWSHRNKITNRDETLSFWYERT